MTRSIVIVSLWLLLVDGIVEAVHSAAGSPLRLLAFYYAISAATVLALWLHFRDDGRDDGRGAAEERSSWRDCEDP